MRPSLAIVIPAFNEQERLPETLMTLANLIDQQVLAFAVKEVWVVDDGSQDQTRAYVEAATQTWPWLHVCGYDVNRGKGAAVHFGLKKTSCDFVLIADADMATPWLEIDKMAPWVGEYDLLMGSRALADSEILVRQHWLRQSMGRTFNKILKIIVGLSFHDTQCGFKLIKCTSVWLKQVLPHLSVERFAWDVELILRMQQAGLAVKEVPVRWEHKEASRVRIIQDSWEMFCTVLKLRWRG